jgi:hypothetical protein
MRNRNRAIDTQHTALKRLYSLQEISLARYAAAAGLYGRDDAKKSLNLIIDIADGQEERASRIGELLAERRQRVPNEVFPMALTSLNYVAAEFVARKLLAKQPELLMAISKCIAALSDDAEGQLLAKRTLDAEWKNLQELQNVAGAAGRVTNEWAEAA